MTITSFATYADYTASKGFGAQVLPEALFNSMKESAALEDREGKFSDEEFAALIRNADGDIVNLSIAFIYLTDAQIENVSGDDFTRVDEMQEELRCMMAEFG